MTENLPLNASLDNSKFVSRLIPFPKKLFSLTPKPNDPPEVPAPAVAKISPVGFSSKEILIVLVLLSSLITIFDSTFLKKLRLLILFIDFVTKISLKGSPSSSNNWLRITFSLVIVFPSIFILSTKIFSLSSIVNFKLIKLSSTFSITLAFINLYCSRVVIVSISSRILSIWLIE